MHTKIKKLFVEHIKEQLAKELAKGIVVSSDLILLNRKSSDSKTFKELSHRMKIWTIAVLGIHYIIYFHGKDSYGFWLEEFYIQLVPFFISSKNFLLTMKSGIY